MLSRRIVRVLGLAGALSAASSAAFAQAPAAQTTTTQPVGQNAGQMQTMPGAQPTWPTNAPPAPGPWVGPQR